MNEHTTTVTRHFCLTAIAFKMAYKQQMSL